MKVVVNAIEIIGRFCGETIPLVNVRKIYKTRVFHVLRVQMYVSVSFSNFSQNIYQLTNVWRNSPEGAAIWLQETTFCNVYTTWHVPHDRKCEVLLLENFCTKCSNQLLHFLLCHKLLVSCNSMIVLQIHRVVLHTPPLFSVDDASMQYKNENNDEYILFKLFDGPDFDSPEYNGYLNRLWFASSFQALLLVLTNDTKIFRLNLSASVSTSYFYRDNDGTNHLIETV